MRFLKPVWPFFVWVVLALAWRLFLTPYFYGWEESDYGNLAMARGVLESGFTDFDMKHLPFYYFCSALVLALVGDTIVATHTVSILTGSLSVGLGYLIARRVFGEGAGRITGLLLCFQPEFALYASSSLREPLFTCLVLLGLWLLLEGRPKSAAAATGFSFLTRFDSMLIGMPALVWHLVRRPPRLSSPRHPLWPTLGIFGLFVALWSLYCGIHHGTYLFFMPTVQINIDTGGAQEVVAWQERLRGGLEVVFALFTQTLPKHLSWSVWGAALVGLFLTRREWFARVPRGTLFVYLALNTGFWLGIGLVGQHEPDHNLYWKWLYPMVPYWTSFAAYAWMFVWERVPGPLWKGGLVVMGLLSVGVPWARETQHQIDLSVQLYKPQVELARWVEAQVPPGTAMVFDNIPACYVNRKPHAWKFISWYDVPVPPGDEAAFADWLKAQDIRYVLWFKEEWTQASVLAPYLSEVKPHKVGDVLLEPLQHEEGYGFIFYAVSQGGQGLEGQRSGASDVRSEGAPRD